MLRKGGKGFLFRAVPPWKSGSVESSDAAGHGRDTCVLRLFQLLPPNVLLMTSVHTQSRDEAMRNSICLLSPLAEVKLCVVCVAFAREFPRRFSQITGQRIQGYFFSSPRSRTPPLSCSVGKTMWIGDVQLLCLTVGFNSFCDVGSYRADPVDWLREVRWCLAGTFAFLATYLGNTKRSRRS